jgi:hypothetical protein
LEEGEELGSNILRRRPTWSSVLDRKMEGEEPGSNILRGRPTYQLEPVLPYDPFQPT